MRPGKRTVDCRRETFTNFAINFWPTAILAIFLGHGGLRSSDAVIEPEVDNLLRVG